MENDSLLNLTSRYFEVKGYAVEHDLKYMGVSGLLYSFNLKVRKNGEEHIVLVIDWNRTIGINMIIKADRAAEDVNITNPIIVGRKFSDHAISYSHKKKITLMTEADLLSRIGEV